MSTLPKQLLQRNGENVIQQSENPPLDLSRLSGSTFVPVRNAAVNHSMRTYALVAGLDVLHGFCIESELPDKSFCRLHSTREDGKG